MVLADSESGRTRIANQGVDTFFYIVGEPMLSVESAALALAAIRSRVTQENFAAWHGRLAE